MNAPINTGGPAYPAIHAPSGFGVDQGMTLRDHFATYAPEAPAWWWWQQGMSENASVADMARWNYVWADAMLKAREAK